ncbi:(p)ppGpp synthetase I, SpoT/RelA [Desulfurobacterium thermolithotrophum DSM 11699]|uniref:(P)ppGpp synthetase I, SpoT/RelA n=1 Tax=Desulfurobacterium thermolithotrophum (strain DSM 11699 / BSA) TaxID=868864 RepID=F0S0E4_DESTD|nr:bifunctional (p)ppGpp synthetase/guanosine-3',5'-bis(diphosphate) 3'-pyrophosphohydrolase [Desulfurobacterium thermolithotrophum]ADY72672.1 (p)ppGpp synthetase I, SpoT/RelA [Desulfurobacterium thermolithotrophum DSM 11699]
MRSCKEIIEKVKEYRDSFDEELIIKAYNFAKERHEGQFRKSGEPFFSHPAEVAYILAELRMDTPTIISGLLHDVVEDTDTTIEEIEKEFGKEVAFIVKGVTKLEGYQFSSKEERDAESFRNLLISLAEDIRVLIVKLADRLHNMRTMESMKPESQKRNAKETLTIYAPLANRLGMYRIKNELEDLSLKYLDPETYNELEKKVREKKRKILPYLEEIIKTVREKLKENGLKGDIQWRVKHIYGIYRKMVTKGIPFEEVYDVAGIRVITDTVGACYQILGIIHSIWIPVPGRIKDYIATPKPNMYQSLHTTVVGPKGQFIEFQIRTYEMHQVAEMGIAAHWKYKEGGGALTETEKERFIWLRNLLEWVKEEKNPQEFIETVRNDLYSEDIYVFTPKGDLKTLPVGSTPVDFAYAIHTSIGHRCKAAKVNGKLVPLNHILQSGDKVEIITSNEERPSRDWLNFVKTSKAKNAIKNFIRKEENERARKLGESLVDKMVRKFSEKSLNSIKEEEIEDILKSFGYSNLDSALADVGYGKLDAEKLAKKLLKLPIETEKRKKKKKRVGKVSGIKVDGIDNVMVSLGTCCHPLPGDRVIGVVNSGKGIVIHTANCIVAKQVKESSPGKLVKVEFLPSDRVYNAKIRVTAEDRPGLLANVSSAIAKLKINITSVQTKSLSGRAVLDFIVQVKSKEELQKVIHTIKQVKGVIAAKRIYREKVQKVM